MPCGRFATSLSVYNSLTKQVEPLTTKARDVLNWYACGPTVYDKCHIGHARAYLCMDLIRRTIEHYEPQLQVRLAMGITDIDDKIIARAKQEDRPAAQLTRDYEHQFIADLCRMNIRLPERFLRVSDHIADIVHFIAALLQGQTAYQSSDGSVYFSIRAYTERGHLYPKFRPAACGPDHDAEGAVLEGKQDPRDFALWKAAKPGEPFWRSPWGPGRPGWHIECSAMVKSCFGTDIDLHTGGVDLEFPHHENEIAQSEAFHGHSPWCPHFAHTGHLTLRDTKMSKSLGNTISSADILADRDGADDFRMLCLLSHYREPLSFTTDKLKVAAAARARLLHWLDSLEGLVPPDSGAVCGDRFDSVDCRLLLALAEFRSLKRNSLQDDFDWTKVMRPLAEGGSLMASARQYMADKAGRPHPLLISHLQDELQSLLGLFGFREPKGGPAPQIECSPMGPIMDDVVAFRGQLRALARSQLATANSGDAHKILAICDNLRNTLHTRGLQISVRPSLHSLSLFCPLGFLKSRIHMEMVHGSQYVVCYALGAQ